MKSKRNFNLFYSIRNFFICKVTVCFLCVIAVCMIPLIKTVSAHAYGGVIDDDPTLVKFDFSGYSSQFPTHDVSNTDSINGILTFHPYSVFFGDENSIIQYFSDRKDLKSKMDNAKNLSKIEVNKDGFYSESEDGEPSTDGLFKGGIKLLDGYKATIYRNGSNGFTGSYKYDESNNNNDDIFRKERPYLEIRQGMVPIWDHFNDITFNKEETASLSDDKLIERDSEFDRKLKWSKTYPNGTPVSKFTFGIAIKAVAFDNVCMTEISNARDKAAKDDKFKEVLKKCHFSGVITFLTSSVTAEQMEENQQKFDDSKQHCGNNIDHLQIDSLLGRILNPYGDYNSIFPFPAWTVFNFIDSYDWNSTTAYSKIVIDIPDSVKQTVKIGHSWETSTSHIQGPHFDDDPNLKYFNEQSDDNQLGRLTFYNGFALSYYDVELWKEVYDTVFPNGNTNDPHALPKSLKTNNSLFYGMMCRGCGEIKVIPISCNATLMEATCTANAFYKLDSYVTMENILNYFKNNETETIKEHENDMYAQTVAPAESFLNIGCINYIERMWDPYDGWLKKDLKDKYDELCTATLDVEEKSFDDFLKDITLYPDNYGSIENDPRNETLKKPYYVQDKDHKIGLFALGHRWAIDTTQGVNNGWSFGSVNGQFKGTLYVKCQNEHCTRLPTTDVNNLSYNRYQQVTGTIEVNAYEDPSQIAATCTTPGGIGYVTDNVFDENNESFTAFKNTYGTKKDVYNFSIDNKEVKFKYDADKGIVWDKDAPDNPQYIGKISSAISTEPTGHNWRLVQEKVENIAPADETSFNGKDLQDAILKGSDFDGQGKVTASNLAIKWGQDSNKYSPTLDSVKILYDDGNGFLWLAVVPKGEDKEDIYAVAVFICINDEKHFLAVAIKVPDYNTGNHDYATPDGKDGNVHDHTAGVSSSYNIESASHTQAKKHIYTISIDVSALRYGPDGKANEEEDNLWFKPTKYDNFHTTLGTFQVSSTYSREESHRDAHTWIIDTYYDGDGYEWIASTADTANNNKINRVVVHFKCTDPTCPETFFITLDYVDGKGTFTDSDNAHNNNREVITTDKIVRDYFTANHYQNGYDNYYVNFTLGKIKELSGGQVEDFDYFSLTGSDDQNKWKFENNGTQTIGQNVYNAENISCTGHEWEVDKDYNDGGYENGVKWEETATSGELESGETFSYSYKVYVRLKCVKDTCSDTIILVHVFESPEIIKRDCTNAKKFSFAYEFTQDGIFGDKGDKKDVDEKSKAYVSEFDLFSGYNAEKVDISDAPQDAALGHMWKLDKSYDQNGYHWESLTGDADIDFYMIVHFVCNHEGCNEVLYFTVQEKNKHDEATNDNKLGVHKTVNAATCSTNGEIIYHGTLNIEEKIENYESNHNTWETYDLDGKSSFDPKRDKFLNNTNVYNDSYTVSGADALGHNWRINTQLNDVSTFKRLWGSKQIDGMPSISSYTDGADRENREIIVQNGWIWIARSGGESYEVYVCLFCENDPTHLMAVLIKNRQLVDYPATCTHAEYTEYTASINTPGHPDGLQDSFDERNIPPSSYYEKYGSHTNNFGGVYTYDVDYLTSQINRLNLKTQPTGHSWVIDTTVIGDDDNDGWTWSADYKEATFHIVCENPNCGIQQSFVVDGDNVEHYHIKHTCETDCMEQYIAKLDTVFNKDYDSDSFAYYDPDYDGLKNSYQKITGNDSLNYTLHGEIQVASKLENHEYTDHEGIEFTGHEWTIDEVKGTKGVDWFDNRGVLSLVVYLKCNHDGCEALETLLITNDEDKGIKIENVAHRATCVDSGYNVYSATGITNDNLLALSKAVITKDYSGHFTAKDKFNLSYPDGGKYNEDEEFKDGTRIHYLRNVTSPLGHSYVLDPNPAYDNGFEWSEDGLTVTVHYICMNDGEHTHTITSTKKPSETDGKVTITSTVIRDQSCTSDEYTTYTAIASWKEYNSGNEVTSTKTIKTKEYKGHEWEINNDYPGSNNGWTLGVASVDNKNVYTATLHFICDCGATFSLTTITSSKITPATCIDNEYITYSAIIDLSKFDFKYDFASNKGVFKYDEVTMNVHNYTLFTQKDSFARASESEILEKLSCEFTVITNDSYKGHSWVIDPTYNDIDGYEKGVKWEKVSEDTYSEDTYNVSMYIICSNEDCNAHSQENGFIVTKQVSGDTNVEHATCDKDKILSLKYELSIDDINPALQSHVKIKTTPKDHVVNEELTHYVVLEGKLNHAYTLNENYEGTINVEKPSSSIANGWEWKKLADGGYRATLHLVCYATYDKYYPEDLAHEHVTDSDRQKYIHYHEIEAMATPTMDADCTTKTSVTYSVTISYERTDYSSSYSEAKAEAPGHIWKIDNNFSEEISGVAGLEGIKFNEGIAYRISRTDTTCEDAPIYMVYVKLVCTNNSEHSIVLSFEMEPSTYTPKTDISKGLAEYVQTIKSEAFKADGTVEDEKDKYTVYKLYESVTGIYTTDADRFDGASQSITITLPSQEVGDILGHAWKIDEDYLGSDHGWTWSAVNGTDNVYNATIHFVCSGCNKTFSITKQVIGTVTPATCLENEEVDYEVEIDLIDFSDVVGNKNLPTDLTINNYDNLTINDSFVDTIKELKDTHTIIMNNSFIGHEWIIDTTYNDNYFENGVKWEKVSEDTYNVSVYVKCNNSSHGLENGFVVTKQVVGTTNVEHATCDEEKILSLSYELTVGDINNVLGKAVITDKDHVVDGTVTYSVIIENKLEHKYVKDVNKGNRIKAYDLEEFEPLTDQEGWDWEEQIHGGYNVTLYLACYATYDKYYPEDLAHEHVTDPDRQKYIHYHELHAITVPDIDGDCTTAKAITYIATVYYQNNVYTSSYSENHEAVPGHTWKIDNNFEGTIDDVEGLEDIEFNAGLAYKQIRDDVNNNPVYMVYVKLVCTNNSEHSIVLSFEMEASSYQVHDHVSPSVAKYEKTIGTDIFEDVNKVNENYTVYYLYNSLSGTYTTGMDKFDGLSRTITINLPDQTSNDAIGHSWEVVGWTWSAVANEQNTYYATIQFSCDCGLTFSMTTIVKGEKTPETCTNDSYVTYNVSMNALDFANLPGNEYSDGDNTITIGNYNNLTSKDKYSDGAIERLSSEHIVTMENSHTGHRWVVDKDYETDEFVKGVKWERINSTTYKLSVCVKCENEGCFANNNHIIVVINEVNGVADREQATCLENRNLSLSYTLKIDDITYALNLLDGEKTVTTMKDNIVDATISTNIVIENALGHSWNAPVWTWLVNNRVAIATFVCEHDSSHVVEVYATTDGKENKVVIDESNKATCDAAGKISYAATVIGPDGKTYSDKYEREIEALGHHYVLDSIEWADDMSSATVHYVCTNDNSHKHEEEAIVTSEITQKQTCEDAEITLYTAKASWSEYNSGEEVVVTKEVQTKEALGHNWNKPEWTWSEDHSVVHAKFTCENDKEGNHIVEVIATTDGTDNKVIKDDSQKVTCETEGKVIYTATVLGPDGEVYSTKYEEVTPALGHNYIVDPAYDNGFEWSEDGTIAKVHYICTNDNSHKHVENADVTFVVTQKQTCEDAEITLYTAKASWSEYNSGEEVVDTKEVQTKEALGHNWNKPEWTWSEDHSVAHAKFTCENDKEGNHIVEVIATTDGTDNKVVVDNSNKATCEDAGSIVYTATVVGPDGETYTNIVSIIIDAFGHNYILDPAYENGFEWSDDMTSAKVHYICTNDGSHKHVEEAIVTSEVTQAQTCENDEIITYTATASFEEYNNGAIVKDTKVVKTKNALGHSWNAPVWTWNSDHTVAHAMFTCANNSSHVIEIVATKEGEENKVVIDDSQKVTCETDGKVIYTATVLGPDGKVYSTIYENIITKLGHNYIVDSAYDNGFEWSEDGTIAKVHYICTNDNSHKHVENAVVTEQVVAATCTENGYSIYTAKVTFLGKDYSATKTIIRENTALGHKWHLDGWTWNDDYSEAVAGFTCERCGINEVVTATIDVEVDDHETTIYTATVIGPDGLTYTDVVSIEKELDISYVVTLLLVEIATLLVETIILGVLIGNTSIGQLLANRKRKIKQLLVRRSR